MTELVTVVAGEAAESDSEEEINTANVRSSLASRVSAPKGVVVQGEASETESEGEEEFADVSVADTFQGQSPITPLKVGSLPTSPKHDQTEKTPIPPPKYDTLLHRKLRDRNIGLQDDICEAAGEAFQYAIRELHNTNQMLAKSQTVIQEVCHNLMVFSSDLKKIEEMADIINSSTNLPNFTIEVKGQQSKD
ncbi:uncharacterized protein [Amphiura filiformis]|uniref:uncharacterized protein n=1 Tax=Amphiura filiformis TaxID=82378 RepID=UPI003B20B768